MAKEHLQPPDLFASESLGFTQVVTSSPGKLIFVSGQTALDAKLETQGGDDLGKQAAAALDNLSRALAAAGADCADVTSLRIYITDYEPAAMRALGPPLVAFLKGNKPPAQTLIGVQSLAMPELRIEIEATAVVEA